jgi:hypothetical protein
MDAEIALEAMETKYQQAVTMLATRTVPPHQTA